MAKTDLPVYANQAAQMMDLTGLRVRMDTLYSNSKGRQKPAIQKRAAKILDPLREPLRRILAREEVILYVARANPSFSVLEQVVGGWATYYYSQAVLVITNLRLLQLGVDSSGKWKRSIRSLAWGDVSSATAKPGFLGSTLKLVMADKSERNYWKLRRSDAKALQAILPALTAASQGEATGRAMLQLCPSCCGQLVPGRYQCPQCGLAFKDERTLAWRAALIPGGAYFYVGQILPGVGATIAELYLFIILLAFLFGSLGDPSHGGSSKALGLGGIVAAVFVLLVAALEKALSVWHCRKAVREFIPLDGATVRSNTAAVAGA